LAARYLHDFMEQLHAHDPEVLNILLRLLPRLEMTALNEAMDILLRTDRGEGLRAVVRDLTVETQTADAEVLYWLMRNPEYLAKWELGSETDLASWVVRALDKEAEHEHLKAQNQLRARFGQKEWLEPVLKKMEPAERRELVRAIRESRGWSGIDRRGLLGRIIKMYPELESVVADRRKEDKPKASTALPLTAARSYTERQRQLERIVSIEIPEVAKEIGVAREYGDLRENFEYKAAKDKQALLLRRQGEIEDMLHKVRPSDFTNIDTATVAQGTTAVLRYDDGSSEQVTILGVWDRDEDLHIISSDSRLAQALLGRKAGERVEVPSEDGTRTCELVEIKPLSDAVRAWITAEE
jgi:transcription elongation GreA/GreB family factor